MAVQPGKIIGHKNKWEKRKAEFLAGLWSGRYEYFKDKKISDNNNALAKTVGWDEEKYELLKKQTEHVIQLVVDQNEPIKILALNGKYKIVKILSDLLDSGVKDPRILSLGYQVFKTELGEPVTIARNINETPLDKIPDELLEKLKQDAYNAPTSSENLSISSGGAGKPDSGPPDTKS